MAEGCKQAEVRNRVAHMKKAELHVHLEGSIGPETLLAIDPSLTREEIEAQFNMRLVSGVPAGLHLG